MTCENPYTGVPVRSLQTMLRELSFHYPVIPRLIPDGIFGEHTLEAVMLFQREFHPPVTGQVDHGTWDAVSALFQSVRPGSPPRFPAASGPATVLPLPPARTPSTSIPVQAMFRGLSQLLEGIEDAPGLRYPRRRHPGQSPLCPAQRAAPGDRPGRPGHLERSGPAVRPVRHLRPIAPPPA